MARLNKDSYISERTKKLQAQVEESLQQDRLEYDAQLLLEKIPADKQEELMKLLSLKFATKVIDAEQK